MRQKKQLTVMLLLLFVSAAMYIGICIAVDHAPKPAVESYQEAEKLIDLKAEDVNDISWNNGNDDLELKKNADGSWSFSGNENIPVNSQRVEQMIDAVVSLRIKRTLDASKTEDYGFSDANVIHIGTDSGDVDIKIGNKSSLEDQYYLQKSGDDRIFLSSTNLPLMAGSDVMDFVQFESAVYILSPDNMEIEKEDGSCFKMERPEDPEKYSYTNYYSWFSVDAGGNYQALDRGKAEKIVTEAKSPEWTSCVSYGDKDISEFGLDKPVLKAIISDADNKVTVCFGSTAEDGSRYAALDGSSMVYTVKSDLFDDLSEASYESLRAEDICHMDWETVTEMNITYKEGGHDISISLNPSDSEEKYTYTENGKELDPAAVADIKAMIDKMVPAKQLDTKYTPIEKPLLTIEFARNTENYNNMKLEFFRYNDMYDLVSFNGEMRQLISTKAAEAVITLTQRLSN